VLGGSAVRSLAGIFLAAWLAAVAPCFAVDEDQPDLEPYRGQIYLTVIIAMLVGNFLGQAQQAND